ncbi:hypothetical protein RRG08_015756 [Elysia crispata]|uniref:Uncharacterized protein n=1 Tax=Elysia crispata TaxID=231223 RepID=A0AAE0ZHT7_9GAST|nr:hypothetical protein RRG08_015756 [Elysia crispata]
MSAVRQQYQLQSPGGHNLLLYTDVADDYYEVTDTGFSWPFHDLLIWLPAVISIQHKLLRDSDIVTGF